MPAGGPGLRGGWLPPAELAGALAASVAVTALAWYAAVRLDKSHDRVLQAAYLVVTGSKDAGPPEPN